MKSSIGINYGRTNIYENWPLGWLLQNFLQEPYTYFYGSNVLTTASKVQLGDCYMAG